MPHSLPPPDLEAFFSEIGAAVPPDYTPLDRYQDFRALLLGSERGKRVLHQILSWAKMYQTSFDPDPYVTAYNEGGRKIGLMLTAALNLPPELPAEPKPGLSWQINKPKE